MLFLIKRRVSAPLRGARKAFQKHACDFTWDLPCLGLNHQLSCGQETVAAYMGIQAMDSIPFVLLLPQTRLHSPPTFVLSFLLGSPHQCVLFVLFRSNDSKAEYLAWKVVNASPKVFAGSKIRSRPVGKTGWEVGKKDGREGFISEAGVIDWRKTESKKKRMWVGGDGEWRRMDAGSIAYCPKIAYPSGGGEWGGGLLLKRRQRRGGKGKAALNSFASDPGRKAIRSCSIVDIVLLSLGTQRRVL
ncbi:MAG: hypothetical protein J3Q66DRAFT_196110 [Benniella sp.]|nr:MAG: hypothetical protein J3Q66DRAFT_196110 [Benniella sp.]